MDHPPSLSVTNPLSGFLPLWLAAWVLPVCIVVPAIMVTAYLGIQYDADGLSFVAMGMLLLHPVLTALGHGYLMRGRLRRPRLWGVLTGGGLVVAALAFSLSLALFYGRLAMAGQVPGTFSIFAYAVTYYAAAGLLAGLIVGVLQCASLAAPWWLRLGWCGVSVLGGLCAAAWLWAWNEVALLSAWAASIAGSLFDRGEWMEVPMVTAWLAAAVLLHALPTGLAMRRLLCRRAVTESAALAARFD